MASGWGRLLWGVALVGSSITPGRFVDVRAAMASAPLPDPSPECVAIDQSSMVHVFDTGALPGPLHYVNDHTVVQAPDGAWHLFGIFHAEPMGDDTEIELVHAVAQEPEPSRWERGSFEMAGIALRAERRIGETHLWAPQVIGAEGRWVMVYQSGGADDYRAAIRLAESDDLARWRRVGAAPLFEDFCAARDPMLVRHDGAWVLYYTRCDSIARKTSGVAYRVSRDLVHWTEPRMALALGALPATSNSAYTESPFVFERGGYHYLSVSAYPIAWDATLLFRSRSPTSFPDAPISRLRAHAAEWIFDRRGRPFLTHAGPGQRGVWMSAVDGI